MENQIDKIEELKDIEPIDESDIEEVMDWLKGEHKKVYERFGDTFEDYQITQNHDN